jgi:hypothetical protein
MVSRPADHAVKSCDLACLDRSGIREVQSVSILTHTSLQGESGGKQKDPWFSNLLASTSPQSKNNPNPCLTLSTSPFPRWPQQNVRRWIPTLSTSTRRAHVLSYLGTTASSSDSLATLAQGVHPGQTGSGMASFEDLPAETRILVLQHLASINLHSFLASQVRDTNRPCLFRKHRRRCLTRCVVDCLVPPRLAIHKCPAFGEHPAD